MADGMVWLASYPKCGNTWLRSFLAAYAQTQVQAAFDPNTLDSPAAASRRWLDEALGVDTTDLLAPEIRELLPVALRAWAANEQAPRIVKVHDCFGFSRSGQALFPVDVTMGVVHLVRDPRDVAVSLSHHRGATLDETIARLNNGDEWISRAPGAQAAQFLSDWSTHTRSWMDSPLRRLTLRYEDMLAAPVDQFRQVLVFCGLPVDEARLAQAVVATSFSALQSQEKAAGFKERPRKATALFFREGRAGGWQTALTPAQVDAIVTAHGPMMDALGYAA